MSSSPDFAECVGTLSGHYLISVGSHSGLRTGESVQIRLKTAESGRFLNNALLLS